MGIFFLSKPYDRGAVVAGLEKLGFVRRADLDDRVDNVHVYGGYDLDNEGFFVNLTSSREGKCQLQGRYIDEVIEKGISSEHYSMLEKLAGIIKPERIIDARFRELFAELTGR